ncbi:ATP-binding protein [Cloacibacterium normanense]|jgi:ATP-dependent DNA helicase RecG|uniref:ATP-binding protein n=1 Tax=Cloacibacterium normanense TaxID=237258 RepID=UPI00352CA0D9
MTELELKSFLKENFPKENEKCEWKEFKSLKSSISARQGEDLISYISSISNMEGGNIILGIEDKTLKIIGIQDFHDYNIDNIKYRILGNCTNLSSEGFDIVEYVTSDTNKIVWIVKVPKHQFRLPVYAHKKAWQRIGDNLVPMTKERLNNILNENLIIEDWSKKIIEGVSIEDLDEEAIKKARKEFIKRNPKYIDEIEKWDNIKFLDKAKLTIQGKITRACFILLGKEEEEHYLDSAVKIRWNLKTLENQDKDFEIFSIPLILSVDEIYKKIRNLKYRYLREGTLFPDEVLRYDPFVIREPLNNAIAHQDYSKKGRINLVEFEDDHLIFTNLGTFLPKTVENVVLKDSPEEFYRNTFLVEAMRNLGMIETQGGGIRKVFNFQKQRFFPMPEYDFSDEKVKVTIVGKVINEEFAKILIKNPEITLEDTLILDKVQKRKKLTDDEFIYLKKKKFIEGRKGSNYISYNVIEPTKNKDLLADYINNRSLDDRHFKELILEFISKSGKAKRKDIDNFIIPKLSSALTDSKKKNKVTNLLSSLRMEGKIKSLPGYFWEKV